MNKILVALMFYKFYSGKAILKKSKNTKYCA